MLQKVDIQQNHQVKKEESLDKYLNMRSAGIGGKLSEYKYQVRYCTKGNVKSPQYIIQRIQRNV